MTKTDPNASNFIVAKVARDTELGTYGGRVVTRFPPEPNGYLHIGHAKSICLNFGLAERFGGRTHLRYDDTNPEKESMEYVESILKDVRWLGFEPDEVFYASDYFEQLYVWAEKLIADGKAYVDDQNVEQIRENRGTVTEPGTPSPWRDRTPEENLDLFRRMRAGEFPEGSRVLRARIDMGASNMQMRDPLMYRIRFAHHFRKGDDWCIYPMYDFAHGLSDANERITHSLCTLEFENNRELYDWFVDAVGFEQPPKQTEFARLKLSYTLMSKRKLLKLVTDGVVSGWDDPRMPTIAGMRRRGVTPEALRAFCDAIGVAKANSLVDVTLLEHAIRDDLNFKAPRRMAVMEPLEVELVNWDEDRVDTLVGGDFPHDVGLPGERPIPMGRRLYIERSDFMVEPVPGFKRLVPGGEVRLRHSYVIKCEEVLTDDDGKVTGLRCSVDFDTLGRKPQGRKVKGTIHWVSAHEAVPAKLQIIDRLFSVPEPGKDRDFMEDLNPESLTVRQILVEPAAAQIPPGSHVQFERNGYAYRAPEDVSEGLVFNQVVALKDSWAVASEQPVAAAKPKAVDPRASAQAQAEIKREARQAALAADPELAARFEAVPDGVDEDLAFEVARLPEGVELVKGASGKVKPEMAAQWVVNQVAPALDGVEGSKLTGASLGELLAMVESGKLSTKLGRDVLAILITEGGSPQAIAEAKGLVQVSDEDALKAVVDEIMASHPAEAARYAQGDRRLTGFFMGQVMKATKGRANPGAVQKLLATYIG